MFISVKSWNELYVFILFKIFLILIYCEETTSEHILKKNLKCKLIMLPNIALFKLNCCANLKCLLQCNISVDSCIAKGYARSPILGCYRLIKDAKLIQPEAKQRCAQDGGLLLLVNSAEESQEVLSLLGMLLIFWNIELYNI